MPDHADSAPLVAVLAAGRASRFGGGKLDALLEGKPLGRWVLDAVKDAGLEPGVIVVSPDAPAFARSAQGWQLVTNAMRDEGQGTSVALACREAAARSRGVLLLLADMPLIEPEQLRKLATSGANAATRYPDGRLGVPVSIAAEDVGKFADLSGDSGLGRFLADLKDLEVFEANPESLIDVDDPETLEKVRDIVARLG